EDGNDTLAGGSGTDSVVGGDGDDLILFTSGNFRDHVDGGAGRDILDATAQSNPGQVVNFLTGEMTGYTGGATLSVSGIEVYRDGSGGNTIHNSSVAGMGIYGGAGDDTIHSGNSSLETLDGGAGIDLLDTRLFNGDYEVNLVTGLTNWVGESFTNFENIITGDGNDTVTGTAGANEISTSGGNDGVYGGSGDDTLEGGAGADTLNGGGGFDVASYAGSSAAVDVRLNLGTGSSGDGQGDILSNIEGLIGSDYGDILKGNAGANLLDGRAGDDNLSAGGGNDTVYGGTGGDTVS